MILAAGLRRIPFWSMGPVPDVPARSRSLHNPNILWSSVLLILIIVFFGLVRVPLVV